jgi:hypothetical protein
MVINVLIALAFVGALVGKITFYKNYDNMKRK